MIACLTSFFSIEPTELVANATATVEFELGFMCFMNKVLTNFEVIWVRVTNKLSDPVGYPVLMDVAAHEVVNKNNDNTAQRDLESSLRRLEEVFLEH